MVSSAFVTRQAQRRVSTMRAQLKGGPPALVGAGCSAHCPDGQNTQAFSYAYDRYANLWQKNVTAGTGPMLSVTFSTGNNNRIDTFSYDASGNLLNDGTHAYTYNAESEIIQVDSGTTATYLYDADGRRVRKTTATATVDYVYDLAGHQIAEINSSGAWTREEVYAGGHHLATYSGGPTGTTYFDHADWLGTERGGSNMAGTICETIVSFPFGDGEVTSGSCGDVSPMHYTGKQRDTETNLDDFDARYYSSQYGRFMSSDWSAVPVPVPYANLTNPQTLNLYAIVNDNVMTFADLDGHVPLMSRGQSCQGSCNISAPGLSCTLDGIPISCGAVSGLSGAGSLVTENGTAITTESHNGQSDPAKSKSAQEKDAAHPKKKKKNTSKPYSVKRMKTTTLSNGTKIVRYQVVDSDGKPVHNVAVQEHEEVKLALNAEDESNPGYVNLPSGQIYDFIGPKLGQPSGGNSLLITEQTFTAKKDGEEFFLTTMINQYILEKHGSVTAAAVIRIP